MDHQDRHHPRLPYDKTPMTTVATPCQAATSPVTADPSRADRSYVKASSHDAQPHHHAVDVATGRHAGQTL